MSDYMLGVDIGTTSTKAVLFDTDGHVVAHHTVGYPLLTPTPATLRIIASRKLDLSQFPY